MDQITYLKYVTGESDDELLSFLLHKAKQAILAETNRLELPSILEGTQTDLALYFYQRQHAQGEVSRSEGGVSVSYDTSIPPHIMSVVQNYRLARIGGYAFNKG